MNPQQESTADDATQWQELISQCDLLQSATAIAWGNVIESYKAALLGSTTTDPEAALVQYRTARAVQAVSDQALFAFVESRKSRAK